LCPPLEIQRSHIFGKTPIPSEAEQEEKVDAFQRGASTLSCTQILLMWGFANKNTGRS